VADLQRLVTRTAGEGLGAGSSARLLHALLGVGKARFVLAVFGDGPRRLGSAGGAVDRRTHAGEPADECPQQLAGSREHRELGLVVADRADRVLADLRRRRQLDGGELEADLLGGAGADAGLADGAEDQRRARGRTLPMS
jgi:hypothetical protein